MCLMWYVLCDIACYTKYQFEYITSNLQVMHSMSTTTVRLTNIFCENVDFSDVQDDFLSL